MMLVRRIDTNRQISYATYHLKYLQLNINHSKYINIY